MFVKRKIIKPLHQCLSCRNAHMNSASHSRRPRGSEEGEQGERHPIDKTLVARDGGDT